jgi:glutamate carboxypeptidase
MNAHLEAVLSRAALRHGDAEGLLAELVRINSHTRNGPGCDQVAEALVRALASTALAVRRVRAEGYGEHVVFSTPAAARGGAVLLVGHHDTVFPPGTFEGYRRQGAHAFGPGVLDMKGGLVVIVSALWALHEAGVLAGLPLVFVSVSDEEVGSPTSQPLLRELAVDTRAALVFEAGRAGDALITSRRGSGHAKLVAHGRAAHAGNARESGASAILALARAIDAIERLNDQLAEATVSVGLVQGGSARNTVPAHAHAEVDLRFGTLGAKHALLASIDEVCLAAAASVPGTRIDVTIHVSREPWSTSPEGEALAARYGACQAEAGLGAGLAPRAGGGSDANTLAAIGIPVIDGLGPRGQGFHTSGETVELASLPMKAEALIRFLLLNA